MKKEYIVHRHVIESTKEEKEEAYKRVAEIFIRMARKQMEKEKEN